MTAICCICQEKLTCGKACVLSLCGHVCCDNCLLQWASRNNPPNRVECPMCRKKHTYPKNTIRIFFEEEKSDAELLRSEIRSAMKLVEACAREPSEATLAKVLNELKSVSKNAKKLNELQVTASTVSGLDAMVTHLSKRLAPMQSTEELNAELAAARKAAERYARDKTSLSSQCANLEARNASYVAEINTLARTNTELARRCETLSVERSHLQEQSQRQRQQISSLRNQLSECQEGREDAREKIMILKKKLKNSADANETLTMKINHSLSERKTSASANQSILSRSLSRAPRGSFISIPSDSSPEAKHVMLSSDDEENSPHLSESSVEFVGDSDPEPMPIFRELKPVKTPVALFQLPPQASTSKKAPLAGKPTQKRKLVVAPPSSGLELRNGKTTGLVATGPKRSKKC